MGATQCCLWVFLVFLTVPGPERHRWSPGYRQGCRQDVASVVVSRRAVRAIAIV